MQNNKFFADPELAWTRQLRDFAALDMVPDCLEPGSLEDLCWRVVLLNKQIRVGRREGVLEELALLTQTLDGQSHTIWTYRMVLCRALFLGRIGKNEDAVSELFKHPCPDLLERSPIDFALVNNFLGGFSFNCGRLEEALGHYFKALQVARTLTERSVEIAVLNNLGELLHESGNHEFSHEFYQQSLDLIQREKFDDLYCMVAINMAHTDLILGRGTETLERLTPYSSMGCFAGMLHADASRAADCVIALVRSSMGDMKAGQRLNIDLDAYLDWHPDAFHSTSLSLCMARIFFYNRQYDKAIALFSRILDWEESRSALNPWFFLQALSGLVDAYTATGDPERTAFWFWTNVFANGPPRSRLWCMLSVRTFVHELLKIRGPVSKRMIFRGSLKKNHLPIA